MSAIIEAGTFQPRQITCGENSPALTQITTSFSSVQASMPRCFSTPRNNKTLLLKR